MTATAGPKTVPAEIFKAYDIRGIVGRTLTPQVTELIGQAIGSEARDRGQTAIAIGRDGRLSGPTSPPRSRAAYRRAASTWWTSDRSRRRCCISRRITSARAPAWR